MTDIPVDLLVGLTSHGLYTICTTIGHKIKNDVIKTKILKNKSTLKHIAPAIKILSDSLKYYDDSRSERLHELLVSPEVESLIRQIFSTKLIQADEIKTFHSIKEEFINLFILHVELPREQIEEPALALFNALLQLCDEALQIAIEDGSLYAHEAYSSLRYNNLMSELQGIEKSIKLFSSKENLDIKAILEFEKKYREEISHRHGFIMPPFFDIARKIPISKLYVYPNIIKAKKEKSSEEEESFISQSFISSIYRAVLLGDPGSGKSTFVNKLCYDLASHYSDRLFGGRQVTPILVILKDFGAEKKIHSYSILQFIEITANSKYQHDPPPNAFNYLLLNGRVVVIFDGLDELLDTSYRQEISGDIESFCNKYPSTPVIVTSRKVGYDQAPLDENIFDLFQLAPFNEEQVKEYINKWFISDSDLTKEQQIEKSRSFFNESKIVPDLRSNPLMLALMCNIYRGENYIPKNRPEVYEKCALMLFERWDKSRGIHISLPFEAHLRPAMMYIAYWIYTNETLQGGVTEKKLISKATEYLISHRYENKDESEKAASEFIEFCRGRAWVFRDTGTTKDGELLYQFTHRTFLEYFTAAHLVRINETTEELSKILFPKIMKGEWDIVAQLAFQIKNRNTEGSADKMLMDLIKRTKESPENEKQNMLSFAARCLEFIVPLPKVTHYISDAILINLLPENKIKESYPIDTRLPGKLLGFLLYASEENLPIIFDSLKELLISRIKSNDDENAILALEICYNFQIPLLMVTSDITNIKLLENLEKLSKEIIEICLNKIKSLRERDVKLGLDELSHGNITLTNFVKLHGLGHIFSDRSFILFPNIYRTSYAGTMMHCAFMLPYDETQKMKKGCAQIINNLRQFGRIFPSIKLPIDFNSPDDIDWYLERMDLIKQPIKWHPEYDNNILFGSFILIGLMIETKNEKELQRFINRSSKTYLFNLFRNIILGRFETINEKAIRNEIEKCNFSKEQENQIWKWIRKEIQLLNIKQSVTSESLNSQLA